MIKPIPDGFHTVTPYLSVQNAAEAIKFYERAFGASERCRLPMPDGKIGHAELAIGDSVIMLADEFPELRQPISQNIERLTSGPRTLRDRRGRSFPARSRCRGDSQGTGA